MSGDEPKRAQHYANIVVRVEDWQRIGEIALAIQAMERGEVRTFTVVRHVDGRITYEVRP